MSRPPKSAKGISFLIVDQTLKTSMLCTYAWGLIAHAYAYFNNAFSHDGLMVFAPASEEIWKIQLGRILVPVYRFLTRGNIELPWFIGLLALLWMGLAVFLVARMFNIQGKGIVVLSALMVTNVTVSVNTATYIYELDFDMLSVLLAVLAVYLWKMKRRGMWWGGLCVFAVLGIYQCNISISIVLIMMDCAISFLRNEDTLATFKRGLLGIGMLAIGAVLYIVVLQAVLHFSGNQLSQGYNSLNNAIGPKQHSLIDLIKGAYANAVERSLLLHKRVRRYKIFVFPLLIMTGGLIILEIIRCRPKWMNRLLAIALICLLPMGANISYILNDTKAYDLMKYAVYLLLAFPLLLWYGFPELKSCLEKRNYRVCRYVALVLMSLVLFQNVVLSNSLYLKKNLEQDATLSLMTRVVDDIYEIDGYEEGKTEVCFIGLPRFGGQIEGFESLYSFSGTSGQGAISYYNAYKRYFKYIMNLPIKLSSSSKQKKLAATDAVKSMPKYPAAECIQWIDDILVVKLK